MAEIILITTGDRHRSTVADNQLCWSFPFGVLYHHVHRALLSWPGLLPHSPALSSSFKEKRKTNKQKQNPQVSPFQRQEIVKNSALGEIIRFSEHHPSQLSSLHLRIRVTPAGFKTFRTGPRMPTRPQPEVARAFPSQDVTCLDTCLCQLFCWKLKPATVFLHSPGCSQVSFWFSLSRSGLKENKINKNVQGLV